MPDIAPPGHGEIATALLARVDDAGVADSESADGLDPDSTWSLAAAVPTGGAAAVALIEHVWAEPLARAIRRAGGSPLEETWLTCDDRRLLGELLDHPRTPES
jgi:hypothetical protein